MKEIQLTQDQITRVDDEDFERHNQDKWCAQWNPTKKSFYVKRNVRRDGKKTSILLHRVIMGLEPGDPREVHHVNGDTLDNRRSNLEVLTVLEHKDRHRNDPMKNASQYGIGVRRRPSGRFAAQAHVSGKFYHIGTFDTVEEARTARKEFLSRAA